MKSKGGFFESETLCTGIFNVCNMFENKLKKWNCIWGFFLGVANEWEKGTVQAFAMKIF